MPSLWDGSVKISKIVLAVLRKSEILTVIRALVRTIHFLTRKVLEVFLVSAMLVVYVIFPTKPILIEHHHDTGEDLGVLSEFFAWLVDGHDHEFDCCFSDCEGDGVEGDSHGGHHDCSHTHVLIASISPGVCSPSLVFYDPEFERAVSPISGVLDKPTQPCFGLLKPPQVA